MPIEKLPEFAKDGQKNTDDLTLIDGFPVGKKPARQWFNWLFNALMLKINEVIDVKLDKTANAVSATKLETSRIVSFSGAATGSFGFDGSSNSSALLTLANSGVVANTYGSNLKIPVLTVNAKGLITGVSEQQIPIVDDLTTGGSTKLLSAEQGKVLNDRFINDFLNLKSENGYQKLPSGLVLQWGVSSSIPDESSITASFPIVFPNDCLSIQATVNIDTLASGARSVYAKKISTAQFKLTNDSVNTLPAVTAFWLAIGY